MNRILSKFLIGLVFFASVVGVVLADWRFFPSQTLFSPGHIPLIDGPQLYTIEGTCKALIYSKYGTTFKLQTLDFDPLDGSATPGSFFNVTSFEHELVTILHMETYEPFVVTRPSRRLLAVERSPQYQESYRELLFTKYFGTYFIDQLAVTDSNQFLDISPEFNLTFDEPGVMNDDPELIRIDRDRILISYKKESTNQTSLYFRVISGLRFLNPKIQIASTLVHTYQSSGLDTDQFTVVDDLLIVTHRDLWFTFQLPVNGSTAFRIADASHPVQLQNPVASGLHLNPVNESGFIFNNGYQEYTFGWSLFQTPLTDSISNWISGPAQVVTSEYPPIGIKYTLFKTVLQISQISGVIFNEDLNLSINTFQQDGDGWTSVQKESHSTFFNQTAGDLQVKSLMHNSVLVYSTTGNVIQGLVGVVSQSSITGTTGTGTSTSGDEDSTSSPAAALDTLITLM